MSNPVNVNGDVSVYGVSKGAERTNGKLLTHEEYHVVRRSSGGYFSSFKIPFGFRRKAQKIPCVKISLDMIDFRTLNLNFNVKKEYIFFIQ